MCAVHGKTSSRGDLLFAQHIYKHVSWCQAGEEEGPRPSNLSGCAATPCGVVKGACDRAPLVAARGPPAARPSSGPLPGPVCAGSSHGRQRRLAASRRHPRHEKRTPTECFGVATPQDHTPRSPGPAPASSPLPPPLPAVEVGLKFERALFESFVLAGIAARQQTPGKEGPTTGTRGAQARRHGVRRAWRCASRPAGAIFGMCTHCDLIA